MSYVVLARKYRPLDFEAMVGQEHVVQALSNALTQQRLHHAYLFTGTRGVGKTTVSRILAKALNCTGPDGSGGITAHPCGVCASCRDIDTGRFIDYVELDAASNRGVDEISQLLGQAVYKPVVGRFKVYMIDEVHMLSTTAFNAMLKTLEEPPEYLKFVLATTDPQKVPATVLSRCLQFNLRPMAPQTVQEHLVRVLGEERIAAEPGALRLLARAARGSMRDALSLTDQAIAFGGGALGEEGVRRMLGAVDRTHVVRIVDALAAGDGAALIGAVDGLRALGLSAAGTLEEMADLLQRMAVLQAVPDAVDAADPDGPTVARLAGSLPADEVQLLYGIVLHGRAEIGLAPDEYSGLVMVLLRMLAFRPQGGAAREKARPVATARAWPADASLEAGVSARSAPLVSTAAADRAPTEATPTASVPQPSRAPAEVQPATVITSPSARPVASPLTQTVMPPLTPPATVAARPTPRAAALAARPAGVVARPQVARVTPVVAEPPPWLDVPDDDAAFADAGFDAVGFDSAGLDSAGVGETLGAASAYDARGPDAPSPADDPMPMVAPRPSTAGAAVPLRLSALGERWAERVCQMIAAGSIGAMVRELATQAECVAIDDGAVPAVCRLRVEREMLRAPALAEKLQTALSTAWGREVRVETESGTVADSPARREAAERDRRQGEAEQIIHDDPLVRALMAQYATARIVPGSVKPH